MKITSLLFALIFTAGFAFGQKAPNDERPASRPAQFKSTADITGVSDFTVVDSDGVEWNLHTLLEGGTTVVLDLFQAG